MSGPLRGVRIVTMGGLDPGPFCGMLLGDLGAEVVRIDMPRAVDGPLPIDYTVRRSQRSIALDVKDAAGRSILLQPIANADATRRRVEAGFVVGEEAAGPLSGGLAGSAWLGVW